MCKLFSGKVLGFLGLIGLGLAAKPAVGADLVNIDLSGATIGNPIPTGPSGNPVTQYGFFGGFDSPLGTGLVQNVAGMGKAAVLTTNSTNTAVGSLYLDTSLAVTAPQMQLSFDIDILNQAASGYGQTVNAGTTPLLFGMRLYSPSGGDWATTFNVAPTSSTAGNFGFRNVNNTTLQNFGTYNVGDTNHVDIRVDYTTGTANAYLNGVLAYSGYPLRGGIQAAPTTSELFMYLNGSAGTANSVAIGNLTLTTVPLPTSVYMGLGLLAIVGIMRCRGGKLLASA